VAQPAFRQAHRRPMDRDIGLAVATFAEWLEGASEDDRRAASEYRHHYPVGEVRLREQGIWVDPSTSRLTLRPAGVEVRILCGCTRAIGYGSHGHV